MHEIITHSSYECVAGGRHGNQCYTLVEDIPLGLKYIKKNKLYKYSVWHNYIIFIVILLLATSFGLNGPSTGHYYKELKNAGA